MKLPKPIKRGDAWRICVNFNNKRYTSTHDTEQEAKEWSARKILELKDQKKEVTQANVSAYYLVLLLKPILKCQQLKKQAIKRKGYF